LNVDWQNGHCASGPGRGALAHWNAMLGAKEITPVVGDIEAPFSKHNKHLCVMKFERVAGCARSGTPLLFFYVIDCGHTFDFNTTRVGAQRQFKFTVEKILDW
jgi:hypothetical protein